MSDPMSRSGLYMRDMIGVWIDEVPHGNDHSIDAVRCMRHDGRSAERLKYIVRK